MINVRDLTLRHGGRKLLADITVTLADGEIVGVIGAAGSGKSLFGLALAGLAGGSGKVACDGVAPSGLARRSRNVSVAHLGASAGEHPEGTLYDFILLGRYAHKRLFRSLSEADRQTAADYLRRFDLEAHATVPFHELSASRKKMARLAHVFCREAKHLVLDDPAAGLDIASMKLLQRAIARYTVEGDRIVVFTSNDLNFAAQTADRILVLDEGMLVESGTPQMIDADLVRKYFRTDVTVSRNIYNGKPEVHFFPEN